MIDNSFTREQAFAACRDHRHLVGTEYDEECLVADIVVCPLDPLNKWIFNTFYNEGKNALRSLEFYHGPFYDVIVMSDNPAKYRDLRSFLKLKNIAFAAERY